HQPAKAVLETDPGGKAKVSGRGRGVSESASHAVHCACRSEFDMEVGLHRAKQRLCQLQQTSLNPAPYIVKSFVDVTLYRQHIGASDVLGVYEVHRLHSVTEDKRRLAGSDPLHPSDEHLCVHPMD